MNKLKNESERDHEQFTTKQRDWEGGGCCVCFPLSFVQGLLQNNPHHPIQTERNVTRGRDLCERERGTANESEGEVFLA